MTRSIAIVLFDAAEELDFVGPWEVLTFGRQSDANALVTRRRASPHIERWLNLSPLGPNC